MTRWRQWQVIIRLETLKLWLDFVAVKANFYCFCFKPRMMSLKTLHAGCVCRILVKQKCWLLLKSSWQTNCIVYSKGVKWWLRCLYIHSLFFFYFFFIYRSLTMTICLFTQVLNFSELFSVLSWTLFLVLFSESFNFVWVFSFSICCFCCFI